MVRQSPACNIGRLDAQSLAHIFKYVEFHARREVVPLVCKQWRGASGPHSPIWECCELTHPAQRLKTQGRVGLVLRWSAVVRWFAARVGRVKRITFGTFAQGSARHDLHSSAVSALIALLHGSLERVVVLGVRASHGATQMCDTSMYGLLREAPRLTSLELRGIDFPGSVHASCPFSALAGAPIRYLELRVTRFHDDTRRSMEEALTSVLAHLPQLAWLDMSFPRNNWSWTTTRDWLAPTGLTSLTSLRLVHVKPSNGLSTLINLQELTLTQSYQSVAGNHLNLSTLTGLTSLDLSDNKALGPIASLAGLTALRSLDLSLTGVTAEQLEEAPLSAQHLTKLWLANNQLKTLPASIAAMTSLVDLNLCGNLLIALPPGRYLSSLTLLNLEACPIRRFPAQLCGASRLEDLRLGGTAFAIQGTSTATMRLLAGLPQLRQVLTHPYRSVRWAREVRGGVPPSWRDPAFAPIFNGADLDGLDDVEQLGAVMAGGPAYEAELAAQEAEAHLHGGFGYHGMHGGGPAVMDWMGMGGMHSEDEDYNHDEDYDYDGEDYDDEDEDEDEEDDFDEDEDGAW